MKKQEILNKGLEFLSLFLKKTEEKQKNTKGDFVGLWVIVRGYYSGCHFGKIKEMGENYVILEDSRRLWRWWCKKGVGLTDLATCGLADRSEVKICRTIPLIKIQETEKGISEIIPVAVDMIEHFQLYKEAEQS